MAARFRKRADHTSGHPDVAAGGEGMRTRGATFHSMRHIWASWQVRGGTPLRALQEMGGWATLEIRTPGLLVRS